MDTLPRQRDFRRPYFFQRYICQVYFFGHLHFCIRWVGAWRPFSKMAALEKWDLNKIGKSLIKGVHFNIYGHLIAQIEGL